MPTSFHCERQPAAPHSEMAALIERFTRSDGFHETAIQSLRLFRFTQPKISFYNSQCPALCLIAQGAKCVTLGDDNYFYDPAHFFLVSVVLPLIGQITHASNLEPYLGFHLVIDPKQIGALLTELDAPRKSAPTRGISVGCVDEPLLDAAMRLLRLLETPQHIGVLGPMIEREILYLMLMSDEGANLRRIAFASGDAGVMRALSWLNQNFTAPLQIESLARHVHMSPSGFHHQFKAVTAMTPLQYQKQLRLQEARRLMLGEELTASTASARVGYESASQFSREYRKMFGESPQRDVSRLRQSNWPGQG